MNGIDFRWGMDSLDDSLAGGTTVPGFILRHYHQVGVTVQEMMLIIHLSAYHFNSKRGKASPSLATIAGLMGYAKDDSVRRMVRRLEKEKFLVVERVPGKCSVYNFHGLTRACFRLDDDEQQAANTPTGVGDPVPPSDGVPHCSGRVSPPLEWGTPPHCSGTEEREKKENPKKEKAAAAHPPDPAVVPIENAAAAAEMARSNIFTAYENNIGLINPIMAETLKAAEQEYPADWIEDAIHEAVRQNVRRWAYVEAILLRRKNDGGQNARTRSPKRSGQSSPNTGGTAPGGAGSPRLYTPEEAAEIKRRLRQNGRWGAPAPRPETAGDDAAASPSG